MFLAEMIQLHRDIAPRHPLVNIKPKLYLFQTVKTKEVKYSHLVRSCEFSYKTLWVC